MATEAREAQAAQCPPRRPRRPSTGTYGVHHNAWHPASARVRRVSCLLLLMEASWFRARGRGGRRVRRARPPERGAAVRGQREPVRDGYATVTRRLAAARTRSPKRTEWLHANAHHGADEEAEEDGRAIHSGSFSARDGALRALVCAAADAALVISESLRRSWCTSIIWQSMQRPSGTACSRPRRRPRPSGTACPRPRRRRAWVAASAVPGASSAVPGATSAVPSARVQRAARPAAYLAATAAGSAHQSG